MSGRESSRHPLRKVLDQFSPVRFLEERAVALRPVVKLHRFGLARRTVGFRTGVDAGSSLAPPVNKNIRATPRSTSALICPRSTPGSGQSRNSAALMRWKRRACANVASGTASRQPEVSPAGGAGVPSDTTTPCGPGHQLTARRPRADPRAPAASPDGRAAQPPTTKRRKPCWLFQRVHVGAHGFQQGRSLRAAASPIRAHRSGSWRCPPAQVAGQGAHAAGTDRCDG